MKTLLKTIGLFVVLLVIVSLSLSVSFVLPYPWSKVNILYTTLLLFLAFRAQGSVVWMSFIAHLFLELYAVTPFGVILFSGTLSTLLAYWAYQYLFSNRSWYAMLAMSAMTLIVYRSLYMISLWIAHLITGKGTVPWGAIISTTGWEILFTTLLVGMLYLAFFYRRHTYPGTRPYGR